MSQKFIELKKVFCTLNQVFHAIINVFRKIIEKRWCKYKKLNSFWSVFKEIKLLENYIFYKL